MLISSPKFIEYDDIHPELLEEARDLIAAALQTSSATSSPRLIHTCGIPGAGKTTHANNWLAQNRSFKMVQFDDVMSRLSGYRQDAALLGPVKAFARWEMKARSIGYHLFQALIEHDRDVLFDHSAAAQPHIDLIEKVRARGYYVEMHYIECAQVEAVERVKRREKIILRHTPEHLIYERHELLQQLLPQYQMLVDNFVWLPQAAQTAASMQTVQINSSTVLAAT